MTKAGDHKNCRHVLRPERQDPSDGLIRSAILEVAEGRIVDEIVDRNGTIESEMENDEGTPEDAREDVFMEKGPPSFLRPGLVARHGACRGRRSLQGPR